MLDFSDMASTVSEAQNEKPAEYQKETITSTTDEIRYNLGLILLPMQKFFLMQLKSSAKRTFDNHLEGDILWREKADRNFKQTQIDSAK